MPFPTKQQPTTTPPPHTSPPPLTSSSFSSRPTRLQKMKRVLGLARRPERRPGMLTRIVRMFFGRQKHAHNAVKEDITDEEGAWQDISLGDKECHVCKSLHCRYCEKELERSREFCPPSAFGHSVVRTPPAPSKAALDLASRVALPRNPALNLASPVALSPTPSPARNPEIPVALSEDLIALVLASRAALYRNPATPVALWHYDIAAALNLVRTAPVLAEVVSSGAIWSQLRVLEPGEHPSSRSRTGAAPLQPLLLSSRILFSLSYLSHHRLPHFWPFPLEGVHQAS